MTLTPPTAAATAAAPAAVTPEQLAEINLGVERERRFVFASSLAAMNGYGLGFMAVLALLTGLFDPTSWLTAGVLGMLAYTELRARKLLALFDRSALVLLVRNQLALIAFVWVYAALRVYLSLRVDNALSQVLEENPGAADALASSDFAGDAELYYRYGIIGFYALLAFITLIFQGGCAYYYHTRRAYLEEFLTRTPAWVIEWKRTRPR